VEHFVYKEAGVEPDAVLAFLSDGRRLKTENLRDLGAAQDQVLVVAVCL
jgi:autophagy-related protein 11